MVKQHSWSEHQRGVFEPNFGDPDNSITLKLDEFEIGGMIDAFERKFEGDEDGRFLITRSFEDVQISLSITLATIRGIKCFKLKIAKNDLIFATGLTFQESTTIREALKWALAEIFKERHEIREKKREEKKAEECEESDEHLEL